MDVRAGRTLASSRLLLAPLRFFPALESFRPCICHVHVLGHTWILNFSESWVTSKIFRDHFFLLEASLPYRPLRDREKSLRQSSPHLLERGAFWSRHGAWGQRDGPRAAGRAGWRVTLEWELVKAEPCVYSPSENVGNLEFVAHLCL